MRINTYKIKALNEYGFNCNLWYICIDATYPSWENTYMNVSMG